MHRLPELGDRAQAVVPLSKAVAPPSQSSKTEPWAVPLPTQAVPPLAKKFGSEWADPFGPIWVYQVPNCPQIKLIGSPPIPNLIYMITTIFLKTFTTPCSGASITSSGKLPANIRQTSSDAPTDFRQTPGLATIHLASSDELLWQAPGLLGFVPAEPPTTVRTSVELSNSQRDHSLDFGTTPATCLSFIIVNPAHLSQHID